MIIYGTVAKVTVADIVYWMSGNVVSQGKNCIPRLPQNAFRNHLKTPANITFPDDLDPGNNDLTIVHVL